MTLVGASLPLEPRDHGRGATWGPTGFLQQHGVKGAVCPGPEGPQTEATPRCSEGKERVEGGHTHLQAGRKRGQEGLAALRGAMAWDDHVEGLGRESCQPVWNPRPV